MKWAEWADERLQELQRASLDREIHDFTGGGISLVDEAGCALVSFASNDYFGLTGHPVVIEAARLAAAEHGAGSGSARLIAGSRPVHTTLERELAAWKGEEAALLFSSGYAANVGVLSCFGTEGTTILSDELNHASIVDGSRLARADVVVYPHRDVDAVRDLLQRVERAIVVTDVVFSMDGDVAPVDDLAELCASHGALLILDEAHTALGPHYDLTRVEHVRVGTLSKMLGSSGGFAASGSSMVRLMVNSARSFVFTTAGSPADAAAALAALQILQSEEGEGLRAHLARLIGMVAPGRKIPIFTTEVGGEADALAASASLRERGLLVPAIRPPTVPAGTARLRISLSAAHTTEHVERLIDALEELELSPWQG